MSFSRSIGRSLVVLLGMALAIPGRADSGQGLGDLSIEQLMNESVTSVSKREQKLGDVAAAIFVLSNDDLRRSGYTSVADALRLVPGMDVGSLNASHWAISSRGFNNLYANKLLVLVDGRVIYTPLFGGVYWDLQQLMLEDVDRIEVIRGPGATVWGANAMNGVINIVTRSAKDSQGGLVDAGGGNVHQAVGGSRYGGKIGDRTYYRVFGNYLRDANSSLTDGQPANDRWQGGSAGFRFDHYPQEGTQLTWQANATLSDLDNGTSHGFNVNTLGRWTRHWSARSGAEVQAYYDRTYRNESARSVLDTLDFSFQRTLGLGDRNDLIWGLGYRNTGVVLDSTSPFAQVTDHRLNLQLFSAFVQDEFQVVPNRLTLTAGVKLERNDFTGLEIQPTVRGVFKPADRQTVWAAVSRAVRTPSIIEGHDAVDIFYGAPFVGPGGGTYIPTLVGNSSLKSEVLWAYELGYRVQPSERVSLDIATFYNNYTKLISVGEISGFEPGQPVGIAVLPWSNLWTGHTYGGEVSVTYSPTNSWRMIGTYSLLFAHISGPADTSPATTEQSAPRHQVSLRSSYDFSNRLSLDADVRYVGSILSVPSYVTGDLRLSYRPNDRLEFSLAAQNLVDHQEQAPVPPFSAAAEVSRGVLGRIAWRF